MKPDPYKQRRSRRYQASKGIVRDNKAGKETLSTNSLPSNSYRFDDTSDFNSSFVKFDHNSVEELEQVIDSIKLESSITSTDATLMSGNNNNTISNNHTFIGDFDNDALVKISSTFNINEFSGIKEDWILHTLLKVTRNNEKCESLNIFEDNLDSALFQKIDKKKKKTAAVNKSRILNEESKDEIDCLLDE